MTCDFCSSQEEVLKRGQMNGEVHLHLDSPNISECTERLHMTDKIRVTFLEYGLRPADIARGQSLCDDDTEEFMVETVKHKMKVVLLEVCVKSFRAII
ncbi:hypothetical protein JOB18_017678 [Solea senegalensis]|uniref:Uncharacterized protein n=1 Tax=Solea senegalensis TaxID=28829 RepID=A0AAV6SX95_SOLSE|nr:hypothetical protein JOB18_017678 [Solea senegalensis]